MEMSRVPSSSHEAIYRVEDRDAGLTGFIALHSSALGPAAGGLRMRPYESEGAALEDVKRLSMGMTLKNAAADLPLGGGKAVIIGDPEGTEVEAQLLAFGRAIEALEGDYWTAEDMGMTPTHMAMVATQTRYVAGLDTGPFASGDPSPITARGIFGAMQEAARQRFGSDDLSGRHVAVQGLGNVGWNLAALLSKAGAKLTVTDTDPDRVARAAEAFGAQPVTPEDVFGVTADIFAPCAIGGVLNAGTIPLLQARIVAGGANNQLAHDEDAAALHARGILYAPDFVANGGGIINVATEILRIEDRDDWVAQKLAALRSTMGAILSRAAEMNLSPDTVATDIVRERLETSNMNRRSV